MIRWSNHDQKTFKSSTIKNWRTFGQTMTNPCSMLRWLADRVPRPLRVPNNRGASFVTKILPNSQNLPWPNRIDYYDHLQLSTAATVSPQQVEPLGRVFHFQCRHIPAVSQRLAVVPCAQIKTCGLKPIWFAKHGMGMHGFCPECRLVLQLPCILQHTTSFPASEMLRLTLLNKPFKANWMRMSPQGKALPNAKRPSLFPKNIYVLWWAWMHA